MVLKCCVPNCKINYASSNDKVPAYKLPQNNKDKKKWIVVIPRANFVVSKYTAVCRIHWPENTTFILVYGKQKPKDQPFTFNSSNFPLFVSTLVNYTHGIRYHNISKSIPFCLSYFSATMRL